YVCGRRAGGKASGGSNLPVRRPPRDTPPLLRESRVGLEFTELLRSPVWRGEGAASGRRQPVMLVSGFLANDESLGWMARWLKNTGHRPCRAGISWNVDCSGRSVERL